MAKQFRESLLADLVHTVHTVYFLAAIVVQVNSAKKFSIYDYF